MPVLVTTGTYYLMIILLARPAHFFYYMLTRKNLDYRHSDNGGTSTLCSRNEQIKNLFNHLSEFNTWTNLVKLNKNLHGLLANVLIDSTNQNKELAVELQFDVKLITNLAIALNENKDLIKEVCNG